MKLLFFDLETTGTNPGKARETILTEQMQCTCITNT